MVTNIVCDKRSTPYAFSEIQNKIILDKAIDSTRQLNRVLSIALSCFVRSIDCIQSLNFFQEGGGLITLPVINSTDMLDKKKRFF